MNKVQIAFILIGLVLIAGGVLLWTFPEIFKYVYAVISILVGVGIIAIMGRPGKK